LPENYLETDLSNIAYGSYNKKNTLPSKSKIQKEIADYLELTLPFCIDETEFPDFDISIKEASASSKIKQDSVVVNAKLPVSASREEESFTIDREYETEIPIRLGEIYHVVEEIVGKQITEGDYIPVLIGIKNYNEIRDLQGPENDIKLMEKFLKDNGFSSENLVKIVSPTKEEFLKKLGGVKKKYPDKKFIFYYSGHGFQQKNNGKENYYLVPKDGSITSVNGKVKVQNGVSAKELYQVLPKSSIAILDACHSGGMIQGSNGIVLASSSKDQYSYEREDTKEGIFTSTLVKSMSKDKIPEIDKALEKFPKLAGKVEDKAWQTKIIAKARAGDIQTPQLSGLVISDLETSEESILLIINKDNFGKEPNNPVYITQQKSLKHKLPNIFQTQTILINL